MNSRNALPHSWPAALTLAGLLTLLTFFAVTPAYGQANAFPPGKMTFQGFLTDAGNPPVPLGDANPENKTILFKIYKSATGTTSGDVLWAEQQVVTVDKGHFSVLLGEGSSVSGFSHNTDLSGVFIGADASERYIGITVDGAEITPRIQFFAAPYAQLARAANSLTSGAVFSGSAQIGTTANPGATLEFGAGKSGKQADAGKIGYETLTTGALDIIGAGTASGSRKIKLWDIVEVGTSLGIGTSSPGATLDVRGDAIFQRSGGTTLNVQTPASDARIFASGTSSTLLLNPTGGNVGIGTDSPAARLHLSGGGMRIEGKHVIEFGGGLAKEVNAGKIGYQTFSSGLDIVGAGADTPSRRVFIHAQGGTTFWGRVGIDTDNPSQAKLVVNGTAGTDNIGNHASFTTAGGGGTAVGTWAMGDVSIKGSHAIHAAHFRAVSDARIKNIQGRSDGSADLDTLKHIEVVDYVHKDVVSRGNRPQKKVIGQQIEQIFPQAVVTSVDVVPDIYRKAATKDGWVDLATDLKKGERVRLISESHDGIHEVLEVTSERFRTGFNPEGKEVFVFGREVNDFRVVDYEAIAMLNVSATQELIRRVESLKQSEARIAELERKTARFAELEQQVARMAELEAKAARVDSLEREMAELKKLVSGLAQGQTEQRPARNLAAGR